MKKLIAIFLVSLFALALAACNGDPPAPTGNNPTQPTALTQSNPGTDPVQGEIYFAPGGVRIEMGVLPEPVLAALGEPLTSREEPSCALLAKDVVYTYRGFRLTVTYPEQGADYITGIKVQDDTYTIPGGITIGSSLSQVTAAYGTADKEDSGFYYFIKGLSTLKITIINDAVAQILYEYDFENA